MKKKIAVSGINTQQKILSENSATTTRTERRMIKKAVYAAIFLAALSDAAHAAKWVQVVKGDASRIEIDSDSIEVSNVARHQVTFWVREWVINPEVRKQVDHVIQEKIVDCDRKRIAGGRWIGFNANDDEFIRQPGEPDKFSKPEPDSEDADVIIVACRWATTSGSKW